MRFQLVGVLVDVYQSRTGNVYFTILSRQGQFRFRTTLAAVEELQKWELQNVSLSGTAKGRVYKGANSLELVSVDKFELAKS